MNDYVYEDDNGIRIRMVKSFLGPCFIIHDTVTNKNVEIMGLQFAAMVQRIITKDKDYGSFPHGGFSITEDVITIHHDDDRDNHEIILTADKLKEIAMVIL
jgi:hypothetical protein